MKRSSTIFLQAVIVLIGLAALAFLIWEPTAEGVNAHATLSQMYLDPFILYAYTGSIAFFTALYQTFRLLGYIQQDKVFSSEAVKALRTIRSSALVIVAFIAGPLAYLMIVRPGDDIAGGVMMGAFILSVSVVVAVAAGVFEKTLRSAIAIKSENDLTV